MHELLERTSNVFPRRSFESGAASVDNRILGSCTGFSEIDNVSYKGSEKSD